MSYILDAIKKADQKRKLGTVPDVHTVHETPIVEGRRPSWLYGVACVLLLNAAVIGWWLWPASSTKKTPVTPSAERSAAVQGAGSTKKTPVTPPTGRSAAVQGLGTSEPEMPPQPGQSMPQQTPVASVPPPIPAPPPVETEPPPGAPPPPTMTATPPVPRPPTATQPVAAKEAATGKQALVPQSVAAKQANVGKPTSPASTPQPGQARSVAPVAAVQPPPASAVPVVPVLDSAKPEIVQDEPMDSADPGGDDAGTVAEEGGAVAVEEKEVMKPIASSPPPKAKGKRMSEREQEDPELAKIPFLKQLPAETQQGLPELRISFHAYSIKPQSRLVSISGKVLREGQELADGVKLETITAKGVVLEANGQRFRMNVQ
jgi:hypothetical protein